MKPELVIHIILQNPAPGVDYGLQEGKGTDFKTVQIQRGNGNLLQFKCTLLLKFDNKNAPIFAGPFAQGPAKERFIYIDIGTYAGQKNSCWDRRLKIPLTGITTQIIAEAALGENYKIETTVDGCKKDGSPNCGTVKPFNGWKVKK